jgi:aspartate/methionine/tyrosine aminotransferase
MLPLSDAASRIKGQEMFQILATARELERKGKDILHFELGDPDFSTPENIVNAAFNSLKEGDTHYTPSSGLHDLKLMAQKVTLKSRGFTPDIDQLVVTSGANVQIYYAIACTVNPGDEVIVPDPGFVSYYSILNFLNVKSVPVPLREDLGFTMNPEDIEKAITPRTKMIIINSPSNPTGGVVNKEQWQQIYNIAVKYNLYILSDEIYARMIYPDSEKFFSPSEFDKCKRNTIIVNGFSKAYAMTGWRLGVLTAPSHVAERVALLQETQLSCVPGFIQKAGIEALSDRSTPYVKNMLEEYRKRRDIMVDGLNGITGINCYKPKGAFYVFPNIIETGYKSRKLANDLLMNAGIACAPGPVFGPHGEGYLRFCYVNSIENIEKMLERLNKFLSAGK